MRSMLTLMHSKLTLGGLYYLDKLGKYYFDLQQESNCCMVNIYIIKIYI